MDSSHNQRWAAAQETNPRVYALPRTAAAWSMVLAPAGACAYLAGFALPVAWPLGLDLPLVVLASCTAVAAMKSGARNRDARAP